MIEVPVERIIQVDYETGRYVTVKKAADDNYLSTTKLYDALYKNNGYLHKEKLRFIYPRHEDECKCGEIRTRALEIGRADLEATVCEIASQLKYEFGKHVNSNSVAIWITEDQRDSIGYRYSELTYMDIKCVSKFLNKIQKYKSTVKKGMSVLYKKLESNNGGLPTEKIESGIVIDVCKNFIRTNKECVMYSDIISIRSDEKCKK